MRAISERRDRIFEVLQDLRRECAVERSIGNRYRVCGRDDVDLGEVVERLWKVDADVLSHDRPEVALVRFHAAADVNKASFEISGA